MLRTSADGESSRIRRIRKFGCFGSSETGNCPRPEKISIRQQVGTPPPTNISAELLSEKNIDVRLPITASNITAHAERACESGRKRTDRGRGKDHLARAGLGTTKANHGVPVRAAVAAAGAELPRPVLPVRGKLPQPQAAAGVSSEREVTGR